MIDKVTLLVILLHDKLSGNLEIEVDILQLILFIYLHTIVLLSINLYVSPGWTFLITLQYGLLLLLVALLFVAHKTALVDILAIFLPLRKQLI